MVMGGGKDLGKGQGHSFGQGKVETKPKTWS